MLNHHQSASARGISLIEVLITIVILSFGLLGTASLLSKMHLTEMESYQRAQAILLLSEIAEGISSRRSQAASYVSATPFGTGDSQPTSCASLPPDTTARDLCEWSNVLKGASERTGNNNVGALLDARGCITQTQPPDPTLGICRPGIYMVAVAWQGIQPTAAPAIACGQGLYGANDAYRRVVSVPISIGTMACQ